MSTANSTPYAETLPLPPSFPSSSLTLNSNVTLSPQRSNPDLHRILPKAQLSRTLTPRQPFQLPTRTSSPELPPTPSRSSSLRRKPVPDYLPPLPGVVLPSNHPFASRKSSAAGKTLRRSGSDSTMGKMDDDLFFTPPGRSAPPPPPKRNLTPMNAKTPPSRKNGPTTKTVSTSPPETVVNGNPASIERTNTPVSQKDTAVEVEEKEREEALDESQDRAEVASNRPSTFHDGSEDQHESAMPDKTALGPEIAELPNGTASPFGDGPLPIAQTSTPNVYSTQPRRSSSEDSPSIPITPDTVHHAVQQPTVVPSSKANETWDIASEVLFFDKSRAPPPSKTSGLVKQLSRAQAPGRTTIPAGQPIQPDPRSPLLPNPVEADDDSFSVDRVPSKRKMWEAGTCFLRDEDGQLVCFGDLFPRWEEWREGRVLQMNADASKSQNKEKSVSATSRKSPKTVVFFIRHFWCGQCQDYTFASLSLLDPVAIAEAGIKVVVICNGSWKIIKAYKKLFNCPFPIYVDSPRRLYQLLGMTKMTNDFGPFFRGRANYHQRNVPSQLLKGGYNALFKMPIADPGKLTQLGGEFIIAPGYTCEFAHRMTNTSNHMEAPDVLRVAGCEAPTVTEAAEVKLAETQRNELSRFEREMKEWREVRAAEIDKIRARKAARRGERYIPERQSSLNGVGFDDELGESGFVEYVTNGIHGPGLVSGDDEVDERFRRVMAMEETLEVEHEGSSPSGSQGGTHGVEGRIEGGP